MALESKLMVLSSSLGQVYSQYFSTQMFKWIPANLMHGGNPKMDQFCPKIFATLGKMPASGTLFGESPSLQSKVGIGSLLCMNQHHQHYVGGRWGGKVE